ncbi:MAG: DUF3368 domain-containing protein [Nitrospirae bacterium]|nr:MAG: DUF3368 domain-containing protein [Nitrospirota bacterium]
MPAVSDASPLILLEKADCLRLLEKLFGKILIPPAVDKEWLRPGGYITPQWLSVVNLSKDALHVAEDMSQRIDRGEAEAIALFSSVKADWLLLDDLKARRHAMSLGIPVVGTLGILVAARQKGMIPKLAPVLDILKSSRFYISDETFKKALMLVNEAD